jgi:membrane-bound serine protease (ClpP class)
MYRLNKISFISLLLLLLGFQIYPQQKVVYLGLIDGEIDLGLSPYVSRVISEAEKENADAVIFKINTFGGRVDAATQIKDAILASKVLTIAFINNRAISAGSLIASSCKKIAMVPGSSIGAATVVDQSGQKVGEKYQSYMRSEMRSTAERNGRRTDIAQGMVDERIVVEGLDDSTQLITLTSDEAKKYGIADTLVNDLDDVLEAFSLEGSEIKRINSNWAEDVVRFINNPIVSSLLIMVGLLGLYTEIKTPGWGLPGTVGLIALALFFGSSYILQLASIVEILLFVTGLILLAVEIFVIPGFGFAGIGGIVLIVAALFLALLGADPFIDWDQVSVAIFQLTGALVLSLLVFFIILKYLPKSSTFSKLVLAEEESADKGFVSYPSDKELIGKEGIALTDLRPAGSAEFNGERIDVIADWDYIVKGKKIKVIRVEGIKVVVKEVPA